MRAPSSQLRLSLILTSHPLTSHRHSSGENYSTQNNIHVDSPQDPIYLFLNLFTPVIKHRMQRCTSQIFLNIKDFREFLRLEQGSFTSSHNRYQEQHHRIDFVAYRRILSKYKHFFSSTRKIAFIFVVHRAIISKYGLS